MCPLVAKAGWVFSYFPLLNSALADLYYAMSSTERGNYIVSLNALPEKEVLRK
jgi:hypothetical protein